jgi:hypothetical protein
VPFYIRISSFIRILIWHKGALCFLYDLRRILCFPFRFFKGFKGNNVAQFGFPMMQLDLLEIRNICKVHLHCGYVTHTPSFLCLSVIQSCYSGIKNHIDDLAAEYLEVPDSFIQLKGQFVNRFINKAHHLAPLNSFPDASILASIVYSPPWSSVWDKEARRISPLWGMKGQYRNTAHFLHDR